ncbi:MAG: M28 family peptidase [Lutimonas sp.]
MKHFLILPFLSLILISCNQKASVAVEKNVEISSSKLKEHVSKLASDEFEGRGAGYVGERGAAKYIANVFKELRLESFQKKYNNYSDYLQEFNFHTISSPNPWEILMSQNVLGFIEGETQNEYIVVGGHHDGQGMKGQAILGRDIAEGEVTDTIAALKDSIWNSAVDNAVSIAVIMEIARVLQESKVKLKRSIIFATFSAEESALDGSTYFVNNPVVPKQQIKGMINLEKVVGDSDAEFLYVSYGTNSIFEDIRKLADTLSNIKLTPFYPGIIANTDHYAFTQRSIPAITIGTGSRINVHTALDHADNLDYVLLKNRSQYILNYLIQLANSSGNFTFEGDLSSLLGVSGGLATNEEKLMRNFDGEVAFKVTSVVKDSKGFISGLIPGDLIVAIDDKPIKHQKFYQGLEDVIGESDKKTATLKIIRENQIVISTINLY